MRPKSFTALTVVGVGSFLANAGCASQAQEPPQKANATRGLALRA